MLSKADLDALAAEQAAYVLQDNYDQASVRELLAQAFVRDYRAYNSLHVIHQPYGSVRPS